jgi:hypothetical protein
MAAIIDRLQDYEHKYGEKIAGWAIVLMIVYLVIAQ